MNYTNTHKELASLFNTEEKAIKISNSNIWIRNIPFESNYPQQLIIKKEDSFSNTDSQIKENWNFNYPIFVPDNKKNDRAIILLHGLNERDWKKYLPWAKYLTEKTQRSVILFPIAFHMNRGKKEWSDRHSMSDLVNSRKQNNNGIIKSSYVNVALSNRLAEDPMRFYRAGIQSIMDLLQLFNQIKKGEHPFFKKETQINFFGYSIGALLTQVLFMANPGNLLKNSKAVLFCGGASFSKMSGASKFIMDNLAYDNLVDFYLKGFEKESINISNNIKFKHLGTIIQAFKAMITLPSFKRIKEAALSGLSKKMMAIGLLKDHVVPAKEIFETIKDKHGNSFIKFLSADFPYNYTHENPFPIFSNNLKYKVDNSFENIFSNIAFALK